MRAAEGAHLRHRLPDGRGAEGEPGGDRGLGCPREARPREGQVHPALSPQGGEHRHREQLPEPVRCHQRHGGEIRHARAVQLPSQVTSQTRGQRVQARSEGQGAGAPGLPRLQLPPDALLLHGQRQRHAPRGELVLRLRRQAHLRRLHQDQHREARGPGQGLLRPKRNRH